jgi:hypothetical protein
MNTKASTGTTGRRFLTVFLSLCMLLPSAALADGKNGKKNFKEGTKYEQQQQWDMAAQHFALALSAAEQSRVQNPLPSGPSTRIADVCQSWRRAG